MPSCGIHGTLNSRQPRPAPERRRAGAATQSDERQHQLRRASPPGAIQRGQRGAPAGRASHAEQARRPREWQDQPCQDHSNTTIASTTIAPTAMPAAYQRTRPVCVAAEQRGAGRTVSRRQAAVEQVDDVAAVDAAPARRTAGRTAGRRASRSPSRRTRSGCSAVPTGRAPGRRGGAGRRVEQARRSGCPAATATAADELQQRPPCRPAAAPAAAGSAARRNVEKSGRSPERARQLHEARRSGASTASTTSGTPCAGAGPALLGLVLAPRRRRPGRPCGRCRAAVRNAPSQPGRPQPAARPPDAHAAAEDHVLAVEARPSPAAAPPARRAPIRNVQKTTRQLAPQAAHLEDVVLVVQRQDDHARRRGRAAP